MENGVDESVSREPVRGPVFDQLGRSVEGEIDGVKVDKVDFRKVPKTEKPDVSVYHDEILRRLNNGETIRVIHTALGVTRKMLKFYIDKNEDLKEAFDDANEDILDLNEEIVNEIAAMDCSMVSTENGMFSRVDGRALASKLNAAKFRLERLGAKRGWNAKLETNEVGMGGIAPLIVCGNVSEDLIAESEALVAKANEEAMKGLEGIAHG